MIRKATFTVTVLFDDKECSVDALSAMSMDVLAAEMDDGPLIGRFNLDDVSDGVTDIEAELLAIGNDGTFFGSADDLETE